MRKKQMDSGKNKQKRGKMQEKKTVNSLLTDTHSFGKLYECELTQLNMWRLTHIRLFLVTIWE